MPIRRRGTQYRRHLDNRSSRASRSPRRHQRFELLVERALDELPAAVKPLLQNVAIVIEDEPTPVQLRENGLDATETLYGLYEGTPTVEYAAGWAAFPNKITLFRLPLEEDFPSPEELAEEVRRTVMHELAHHAGFDEGRLHGFGLD